VSDPVFDGYWAKVLETWGDDARHKAFVGYAAQTGRLDEAAVRYRGVVDAPIESDPPSPPEVPTEPAATEPAPSEAPVEEPAAATEPAATEPAATEPAATEPAPASAARAAREAQRADAKRRLESVALAAVMMLDAHKSTDAPVDAKRFGRRLALIFLCVVMIVLAYLMAKMYGAI